METALTPLEFARRARKLYGKLEAVVDENSTFTYTQFFERCDRWSAALQHFGVGPGDRVAYIAPNTPAQLESFYAVPQIGAVLVPINYRLTGDDFAYLINHSGARVVCADSDYLDTVDRIRPQLRDVELFVALNAERQGWLEYEKLLQEFAPRFSPVEARESDLLTINYTSGTSGKPKGVMITHRNAYMNVVGTLVHFPMSTADRYLWTLPMFHASGWTFVWIVTAVGAAHICLRKAQPQTIVDRIVRDRANLLCAAPTVLLFLVTCPPEITSHLPRGVRVLTAGAPPAAATIERIENEFGWTLAHFYGLTETSPFVSVCEPRLEHVSLDPRKRAAIKARQGVELITSGELRVVDESGQQVANDGETLGEIVVRGNSVMLGYYNDPQATAQAIRDGWFHSGDGAVVHPDGYIEIRDRMKDVIISGGENISSIEVEGAILRHPAVREVAVIGIPHERWGEVPEAFVVFRSDASLSEGELREFARENLAHFKVPYRFTLVDELPKTATGKIQKYMLRRGRSAISAV
ncbi:MAG: long-chain-fatty-acid--CoA ligase [Acidobacteriaceae bacterium]|nr:long-chain-fatty-acid--CoA ligase [Acidobacteriaceae bacterium]